MNISIKNTRPRKRELKYNTKALGKNSNYLYIEV
jgi:hypothetical protein